MQIRELICKGLGAIAGAGQVQYINDIISRLPVMPIVAIAPIG
jgi:hypothetical protein